MTRAGGDSIESLFHEARVLPAEQRANFLSERCPDPALRAEVEQLLRDADGPTVIDRLSGLGPPRIPRYRLIDVLGEGGFGMVYRAEQLEPVRRLVAIKVARWSDARGRRLERFEQEMHILARLEHPGIARLYEVGKTPDSRPYLVMECVSGAAITTYCNSRARSVRHRVEMIASVCDAVHYAHQNGVIHRDLKPSNVLVAEVDGKPAPKVIDFGVAKWSGSGADPGLTLEGELIGTPAYMSPEQASHELADARSDVFSLAAMLYELLTGVPPLFAVSDPDAPVPELLAHARQGRFPLASAAAARRGATPGDTEAVRGADVEGDLDAILTKALQREPADRYASVSEFAAELRRYLADEPVLARRPTAGAAIRRFARRHRLGVAVSGIALAGLLAGLAATWLGLVYARRESVSARAQCDLLAELLTRADPLAHGAGTTVRDLLDAASGELSEKSEMIDPELVARTRAVLGRSYAGLGLYDDALRELRGALDAQVCHDVMARTLRAGVLREYADALRHRELWDECQRALAEAVALVPGESTGERIERVALLRSRSHLRAAMQRLDDALIDSASAQREASRLPDCPAALRLHCQTWHGALLRTRERFMESEAVIRSALADAEQALGSEHPQAAMILTDLADTLLFSGRPMEALEPARRALAIRAAALGSAHPYTINSMVTLAAICAELGMFDEADRLRLRALEQRETLNGRDSEPAAVIHYLAGLEALDRGDHDAAIQELSIRLASLDSLSGTPPISLATTRAAYAAALVFSGDTEGAAAQLEIIHRTWSRSVLNPSINLLADACTVAISEREASDVRDRAERVASSAQSLPMLPSRQRLILRLMHAVTLREREPVSRSSTPE